MFIEYLSELQCQYQPSFLRQKAISDFIMETKSAVNPAWLEVTQVKLSLIEVKNLDEIMQNVGYLHFVHWILHKSNFLFGS